MESKANKIQQVEDEEAEPLSNDKDSSHRKKVSCLQWLTIKLKLVDDGATPPNWKYIGLVFIALFSSASTLTFLFPFLPEMILTLGYNENEKGTYAGIIASSVFAGRVVGSVFWGWLADRRGRKLVLLITIGLNGLFAGLFGFATNIAAAVCFRFMCGMVNGTVGTAKTILYDISDNSNQALSMSMLSISWGMGLIVGPAIGGLLASPAQKWPNVFDQNGLFGQFPYLLSSTFPFVSCSVIFIIIYLKFDETYLIKTNKRTNQELDIDETKDNGNVIDQNNCNRSSHNLSPRLSQNLTVQLGRSLQSVNTEIEMMSFLNKHVTLPQSSPYITRVLSHSQPDLLVFPASTVEKSQLSKSAANLCLERVSWQDENVDSGKTDHVKNPLGNIVGANNSHSLSNGAASHNAPIMSQVKSNSEVQEEASSLFQPKNRADTDREDVCQCIESICQLSCCRPCTKTSLFNLLRLTDVWTTIMMYTVFSFTTIAVEDIFPVFASTTHEYGGLGFTTDEIGLAIGAMVLPLLVIQIKLYPFLVSKMGIRKVFLFSAMVSLVTCQALPTVRLLHNNPVWLWVCLIGMQIPFKIATNCCFAGTSLLINNSVTQELAGQANGLAMMTTAMGRTMAPVLAGSLFSWSVTYGEDLGAPFDSSFAFFTIGLLFFVTIFECLHLNPSLDSQKKSIS